MSLTDNTSANYTKKKKKKKVRQTKKYTLISVCVSVNQRRNEGVVTALLTPWPFNFQRD